MLIMAMFRPWEQESPNKGSQSSTSVCAVADVRESNKEARTSFGAEIDDATDNQDSSTSVAAPSAAPPKCCLEALLPHLKSFQDCMRTAPGGRDAPVDSAPVVVKTDISKQNDLLLQALFSDDGQLKFHEPCVLHVFPISKGRLRRLQERASGLRESHHGLVGKQSNNSKKPETKQQFLDFVRAYLARGNPRESFAAGQKGNGQRIDALCALFNRSQRQHGDRRETISRGTTQTWLRAYLSGTLTEESIMMSANTDNRTLNTSPRAGFSALHTPTMVHTTPNLAMSSPVATGLMGTSNNAKGWGASSHVSHYSPAVGQYEHPHAITAHSSALLGHTASVCSPHQRMSSNTGTPHHSQHSHPTPNADHGGKLQPLCSPASDLGYHGMPPMASPQIQAHQAACPTARNAEGYRTSTSSYASDRGYFSEPSATASRLSLPDSRGSSLMAPHRTNERVVLRGSRLSADSSTHVSSASPCASNSLAQFPEQAPPSSSQHQSFSSSSDVRIWHRPMAPHTAAPQRQSSHERFNRAQQLLQHHSGVIASPDGPSEHHHGVHAWTEAGPPPPERSRLGSSHAPSTFDCEHSVSQAPYKYTLHELPADFSPQIYAMEPGRRDLVKEEGQVLRTSGPMRRSSADSMRPAPYYNPREQGSAVYQRTSESA